MKLKYTFEAVNMGDEIIMVPIGKSASQVHGVIKSNEAGQKIIELLQQEKDEDQIVTFLSEQYENSRENLKKYVQKTLDILRAHDLIEE